MLATAVLEILVTTVASADIGAEFYGGDQGGGTGGFGGDGVVSYGGSPNGIGLYVYSADETTANTAAVIIGAVDIYGNLYKSGGAFKIDHPVDPENKYLVHSFVESPDMKNVYDGTVVTDGSGYATVAMPEYFEALNRDFRYQLTVVGPQFAQAIVASEMVKEPFHDSHGSSGCEGFLAGDRHSPGRLGQRASHRKRSGKAGKRKGKVHSPGAVRASRDR